MKRKKDRFEKLEFLRKKCGWTQREIALLIGVTPAAYSHKINRRVPFSFDEVMKIHNAINKKMEKEKRENLSIEDIFLD